MVGGVYTGYRIRRFLSFFTAKGLRFYRPFEGLQGYTGIHVGIVFFQISGFGRQCLCTPHFGWWEFDIRIVEDLPGKYTHTHVSRVVGLLRQGLQ